MNEQQTSRTLLKSPPELWAECSDAQSLAKHLGQSVGEIQITKLEPERTVAWEGDRVSGTVKLEPSGWGTRVTLTCSIPGGQGSGRDPEKVAPEREEVTPEPEEVTPEPEEVTPEPEQDVPEPAAGPPRGRLLGRVVRFLGASRGAAEPAAPTPERSAPEPEGLEPAPREPAPPSTRRPDSPPAAPLPHEYPPAEASEASGAIDAADALAAALDSLGQAHHRPFSRA